MDKSLVTLTHHHISTDFQKFSGKNLEAGGQCGLQQLGMGVSCQALVKMLNDHVDFNPGCQY